MPQAGTVTEVLIAKLREAFEPVAFELIDDSEKHRGHGGWREGGESHFQLRMVSAAFQGKNRVQRQRAVNKVLAAELAGPVHALSMELHAPDEV